MKIRYILVITLFLSITIVSTSMAMLSHCKSLTKQFITRGFLSQKRTNMSYLLFMPSIGTVSVNEPRKINKEIKKAEDIYKKLAKESQKNILEKLNYQNPASDALLGIGESTKQYHFNFLQDELLLKDARTLLDEQLEKSDPLHDLILNLPIFQKKKY